MKYRLPGFAVMLVLLFAALACNLPAGTLAPTQTPLATGGGEGMLNETMAAATSMPGPTETATGMPLPAGAETPMSDFPPPTDTFAPVGPMPTLVPAYMCPPFSIDTDVPGLDNIPGFIGKHYDLHGLPGGMSDVSGIVLDDYHAWSRIQYAGTTVDWLQRLVCRNNDGRAFFTIVDAILLPPRTSDQSQIGLCWRGGLDLHALIGAGSVDTSGPATSIGGIEGWQYNRIDYVYWIDLSVEKFVSLPVEELVCLEPMPGMEGG